MTEHSRANVQNLTGAWRHMGATAHGLPEGAELVAADSWPHRRWIDWGQSIDGDDARAASRFVRDDERAVVPVWGRAAGPLSDALRNDGFDVGFELLAMHRPAGLKLDPVASQVQLQRVTSDHLSDEWTRVASASFGYYIDPPVIRGCFGASGMHFFLATAGGDTVGTVLLHRDETALGVHVMGVLPEQRRRGHARAILHAALETALAERNDDVYLQASLAGEPLYRSMGFEPQFPIPHFVRAKIN